MWTGELVNDTLGSFFAKYLEGVKLEEKLREYLVGLEQLTGDELRQLAALKSGKQMSELIEELVDFDRLSRLAKDPSVQEDMTALIESSEYEIFLRMLIMAFEDRLIGHLSPFHEGDHLNTYSGKVMASIDRQREKYGHAGNSDESQLRWARAYLDPDRDW